MGIQELLIVVPSLTAVIVPDAWARAQEHLTARAAQARKEILATVLAIDAGQSTIRIEELAEPVIVMDTTLVDDEVKLDRLRAGTKVKIAGASSADRIFQAFKIGVAR